jgi:hypothetical protein
LYNVTKIANGNYEDLKGKRIDKGRKYFASAFFTEIS